MTRGRHGRAPRRRHAGSTTWPRAWARLGGCRPTTGVRTGSGPSVSGAAGGAVAERTSTARRRGPTARRPTTVTRARATVGRAAPVAAVRPAAAGAAGRRGPAAFGRLAAVPSSTALGLLVAVLCVVGLVMVGSASPGDLADHLRLPLDDLHPSGALDGGGRRCAAGLRPHRLPRLAPVVGPARRSSPSACWWRCWCPDWGSIAGGSSRWIGFGLLRIQPSELMKLAMVVFAADLVVRRTDRSAPAKQVIAPVIGRPGGIGRPDHQAARHGNGHGPRLHRLRHPLHERRHPAPP